MFTFASWNVNGRHFKPSHFEFIRNTDCDLLALQEATSGFHAELARAGLFDWAISSMDLSESLSHLGRSRSLGCSLFGRAPFSLLSAELLSQLTFPERALVVRSVADFGKMTVCSFHIPPGASWGEIKPQTLKAIAEWLTMQSGTIIFGIDANCPKTDHPGPQKNEWWWDDEPALLGANPAHSLRDTLRTLLNSRPEVLDQIRSQKPCGPLAISHYRGRGKSKTACRYDFIYVSQDLAVHDVKYLYDEAVVAGSDHALVVARLERE
jgi:endonuclease/exonuclease/phosphatase family metal-dependent hydrolase